MGYSLQTPMPNCPCENMKGNFPVLSEISNNYAGNESRKKKKLERRFDENAIIYYRKIVYNYLFYNIQANQPHSLPRGITLASSII